MGSDPKLIIDLLDKYKTGTLTVEEDGVLRNWIGQSLDNQAFFDEVDQDDQYFSRLHEDKVSSLKVLDEVKRRTDNFSTTSKEYSTPTKPIAAPTKINRLSPVFRWVAAASVLAILIGGYTYYRSLNTPNPKPELTSPLASKGQILPGTNKATLVLANGAQITLDSVANGVVAAQGNAQIHKLSNGQLTYTVEPKTTSELLYNTLSVPRGGQYQLTLPDGSKVWLDAASTLRYPTSFSGNDRTVELTGQAYLEVAKNAAKPFQIKVNDLTVSVLGTTFNIMAYAGEPVKTTLLEGSVKVSTQKQQAMLAPGQQAQLGDGLLKVVAVADPDEAVAWKNGLFQFNDADIETVMASLSRWYGVDVKYEEGVDKKAHRLSALIRRDNYASDVLEALSTSGYHFKITGKTITVLP